MSTEKLCVWHNHPCLLEMVIKFLQRKENHHLNACGLPPANNWTKHKRKTWCRDWASRVLAFMSFAWELVQIYSCRNMWKMHNPKEMTCNGTNCREQWQCGSRKDQSQGLSSSFLFHICHSNIGFTCMMNVCWTHALSGALLAVWQWRWISSQTDVMIIWERDNKWCDSLKRDEEGNKRWQQQHFEPFLISQMAWSGSWASPTVASQSLAAVRSGLECVDQVSMHSENLLRQYCASNCIQPPEREIPNEIYCRISTMMDDIQSATVRLRVYVRLAPTNFGSHNKIGDEKFHYLGHA